MQTDYIIREFADGDAKAVLDIFNYFARESPAVYSETELGIEHIEQFIKSARLFYVLISEEKVIGFGFVSPYKPFKNFSHTGVLTYFILPEYTGKGLGSDLFNHIIEEGKKIGITNYLAHISSKNVQSLNFHKKHGFEEAGKFSNVGTKFGNYFDVIWVQKDYSL